jgi:hypothetical protein
MVDIQSAQAQADSLRIDSIKTDTTKIRFRRYAIKKFQEGLSGTWLIDVLRDNQRVYLLRSAKASHLQLITIQNQSTYDLNGDTIPECILQEYIGGEKQTTKWHILGFGREEFKFVTKISTDYAAPWLGDFGGDGIFEVVVRDYTFANWNTDFLNSPYMDVILSWQDGEYRFSQDWMLRDSTTFKEETALNIRQSMQEFYDMATQTYPFKANVLEDTPDKRWGFIPSDLWATMLKLIYKGKADIARTFLDMCWYDKLEGKEQFFQDFKAVLSKSPYWNEIKALNHWEN